MFILPSDRPGVERIIVDITGKYMSLAEMKKFRAAVIDTNLVEPSDCSSELFNGDGLMGKHLLTVDYNQAFSEERKLELAGVIRDIVASIMSEVTVVNCTGLTPKNVH